MSAHPCAELIRVQNTSILDTYNSIGCSIHILIITRLFADEANELADPGVFCRIPVMCKSGHQVMRYQAVILTVNSAAPFDPESVVKIVGLVLQSRIMKFVGSLGAD